MNRLEQLRLIIDNIIRDNPDTEDSRCGFVHLYGVSATCTLLALKRGLDPELCSAAGMLHDIWNYQVGDCPEHGQLGAEEARKILKELASFTPQEIDAICTAISRHGDKQSVDGELDELVKDADVFQHYLYEPTSLPETTFPGATAKSMRIQRLERTLAELGLPPINQV